MLLGLDMVSGGKQKIFFCEFKSGLCVPFVFEKYMRESLLLIKNLCQNTQID